MADLRTEALFHGSVEQVLALLTSAEFLEADALDHDARAVEVLVESAGEVTTTTVRSRMPTDDAPALIKKLLPGEIAITETYAWTGPDAAVSVVIMGGKGTMAGTVALREAEGGTSCVVWGAVKARVPIVGATIASAAVGVISDALRHRCALANEWFARA